MSEQLTDHMGQPIEVGDTVVWAVDRGAYGMRHGVVLAIDASKNIHSQIRVKGEAGKPGGWLAAKGLAVVRPDWQTIEFRKWLEERAMLEDAMERHG